MTSTKPKGCVRCYLTKEWIPKATAFKAEGHYYTSEELYEADKKKRKDRYDLIDYVCKEFLNYAEGAPFSTFLPRKLQEISFYDDDLILQVFHEQASTIHDRFAVMDFANELNKISYMVGIVRNALPEALQRRNREEKQQETNLYVKEEFIPEEVQSPTRASGKDLSSWLDEEDL